MREDIQNYTNNKTRPDLSLQVDGVDIMLLHPINIVNTVRSV